MHELWHGWRTLLPRLGRASAASQAGGAASPALTSKPTCKLSVLHRETVWPEAVRKCAPSGCISMEVTVSCVSRCCTHLPAARSHTLHAALLSFVPAPPSGVAPKALKRWRAACCSHAGA